MIIILIVLSYSLTLLLSTASKTIQSLRRELFECLIDWNSLLLYTSYCSVYRHPYRMYGSRSVAVSLVCSSLPWTWNLGRLVDAYIPSIPYTSIQLSYRSDTSTNIYFYENLDYYLTSRVSLSLSFLSLLSTLPTKIPIGRRGILCKSCFPRR